MNSEGHARKSLRPLIQGKQVPWREEWFYEHHTLPKILPPMEGGRTPRWAYLRWMSTTPPREELYDVGADPLQEHDFAAAPEQRETLGRLRRRWRELSEALR